MKKFFSLLAVGATMIGSASGYKLSKTVTTTANGERQVLRLHLNDPTNEQVFYLGSGDAVGIPLGASGYGTTYPSNRASDFSTQGLVNDIVFPWATSGLQLFSNAAPQQADVPIGTYIGIVETANDLYAQRGCSLQQAPSGAAWPSALVDYGSSNDNEALWGFSANSCPDQGRDNGSGVVIGVYESSSELTSLAITAKVKDRSGTNQDRNIVINVGFSGGNEELCLNGVYEGDTFNSQSQPLSESDSGFTACQVALGGGGGGGATCGSAEGSYASPTDASNACVSTHGADHAFDGSSTVYTSSDPLDLNTNGGCCIYIGGGGGGGGGGTMAGCDDYISQVGCAAGQTPLTGTQFDTATQDPATACCDSSGGGGGSNPFCDSYTCGSGTTKSGASSIECTSGTCDDETCCDAPSGGCASGQVGFNRGGQQKCFRKFSAAVTQQAIEDALDGASSCSSAPVVNFDLFADHKTRSRGRADRREDRRSLFKQIRSERGVCSDDVVFPVNDWLPLKKDLAAWGKIQQVRTKVPNGDNCAVDIDDFTNSVEAFECVHENAGDKCTICTASTEICKVVYDGGDSYSCEGGTLVTEGENDYCECGVHKIGIDSGTGSVDACGVVNGDNSTCCVAYTCTSGTLKSLPESITCPGGGCDDATCCDAPSGGATCDSHACPYGYTLKENPDQISGSDDATCCDAVSSSSGGGGGVVCQGLDFSEDGVVGAADFLPLLNNYGASCSSL